MLYSTVQTVYGEWGCKVKIREYVPGEALPRRYEFVYAGKRYRLRSSMPPSEFEALLREALRYLEHQSSLARAQTEQSLIALLNAIDDRLRTESSYRQLHSKYLLSEKHNEDLSVRLAELESRQQILEKKLAQVREAGRTKRYGASPRREVARARRSSSAAPTTSAEHVKKEKRPLEEYYGLDLFRTPRETSPPVLTREEARQKEIQARLDRNLIGLEMSLFEYMKGQADVSSETEGEKHTRQEERSR